MKRKINGRIEEIYTTDIFLSAICRRITAGEVAAIVGCNPQVATRKLKTMQADGIINGEKVAGRWYFWPL